MRKRGHPTGLVWYSEPRALPIRSRKRIAIYVIAALFTLLALAPSYGCNRYSDLVVGYKSLGMVRDAGNAGDLAVAEWLRHHTKKCLAAHGTKTAAYASCINPRLATQSTWRQAVIGINAALLAAKGALQAYHAYLDGKGGKQVSWVKVLRPAVCGLAKALRVLRAAVPKLGEAAKMLAIVEGVTCVD